MTKPVFIKRLLRDHGGAVAIEFAILGPMLITMMFGVLQVGIAMQAYNAMRSAAADVARFAVVERQKGNTISATSLTTQAGTIASATPYALLDANLTHNVVLVATPQVTGTTEYTLTYSYTVPSLLGVIDLAAIPLTYSRPIFVV